jgi:FHS family L-fucose permease-like MFS transporter
MFVKIPEPHLETAAQRKVKQAHSPLSFRHFIFGAIAIFIYVGVEIGIPSTANLYMTASTSAANAGLGIDATTAGSIVGIYWLLMLVGRLVGASIGAKVSSKAMLAVASTVGLIFVLLGIFGPLETKVSMPVFQSDISFGLAEVPIGVMFLVLCGLCTSVMWGGIFNLAVEGLGKYTATASGIFMVLVCGGGILPLIQGAVADATSYLASFWVIFLGMAYLLYYALIGSKNVNKDIPVE